MGTPLSIQAARLVHYQHYQNVRTAPRETYSVCGKTGHPQDLTDFFSASEVAVPYFMVHPGHEHSHAYYILYYDTFLKLTKP